MQALKSFNEEEIPTYQDEIEIEASFGFLCDVIRRNIERLDKKLSEGKC